MGTITEAGAFGAPAATKGGNMLIQLITPGKGSSGQYSAEVLQEAAKDRVWPAGTLMFADHPGEAESYDRPERSIRDVAGVLVEDARWDGAALVAEARTYEPWSKVLAEMKDAIGVSIRATADVSEGVVTRLDRGISVDFVTQAGRGGKIREVYESARKDAPLLVLDEARPGTAEEATANDTREELERVVRAAYVTDDDRWVYVRDYDDTHVWFTVDSGDETTVWQQTYTMPEATATLTGERTQVRARTEYIPVTTDAAEASPNLPVTPAGESNTHPTNSEEEHMGTIQIEESRLAALEADAGRVQALESERDASNAERDTERAARVAATNRASAIEAIANSGHTFTALERRGLLADLPVDDDGDFDADAFGEQLTEAAADARSTAGTGTVTGFGGFTTDDGKNYAAEADKVVAGAFGRTVKGA